MYTQVDIADFILMFRWFQDFIDCADGHYLKEPKNKIQEEALLLVCKIFVKYLLTKPMLTL